MLAENVAPLEAVWTAVALLGSAVALTLAAHIWLSYRAVTAWIAEGRLVRWGPRHKFALGFLVGVGLLLVVWLGFVALGANALGNPPPTTPDRVAASDRAGSILIGLETVLLGFQAILMYAWVSVGKPTLHPDRAPNSPVALLFRAIDAGREMGHTVANEVQPAVALLDEIASDASLSDERREQATIAVNMLQSAVRRIGELHATIKALEGVR